jgi:hypothetical protein
MVCPGYLVMADDVCAIDGDGFARTDIADEIGGGFIECLGEAAGIVVAAAFVLDAYAVGIGSSRVGGNVSLSNHLSDLSSTTDHVMRWQATSPCSPALDSVESKIRGQVLKYEFFGCVLVLTAAP